MLGHFDVINITGKVCRDCCCFSVRRASPVFLQKRNQSPEVEDKRESLFLGSTNGQPKQTTQAYISKSKPAVYRNNMPIILTA